MNTAFCKPDCLCRWIFWLMCGIFSALLAVILFETPVMMDDLWHSVKSIDEPFAVRFRDTCDLLSAHWYSDSFRFPNQLAPVMLSLLPKWLDAVILGIACMLLFIGGMRLCGLQPGRWAGYVWALAVVVLLPWYDSGFVMSYMLNYIFPSFLSLWLLFYWFSDRPPDFNLIRLLGLVALGFLAGWSHEGFSAPMLCGMLVFLISDKSRSRRGLAIRLAVMSAVFGGMCLVFEGPQFGVRSSGGGPLLKGMPLWEAAVQIGPSVFLVALAVLASIPALAMKFRRPRLLALLTMALAAECVAILFYNGPRTAWGAELFAICALLSLPREYGFGKGSLLTGSITGILCSALILTNLGTTVVAEKRYAREYEDVVRLYRESPDGIVYYDISRPEIDLTLQKTSVRRLSERVSLRFIRNYHSPDKPLALLPSSMKDFTPESASHYGRFMIFRNNIVMRRKDAESVRNLPVVTLLTDQGPKSSRFRPIDFLDAAGRPFTLIQPHLLLLDPEIRITGVSI